jgi:hypothetical protein
LGKVIQFVIIQTDIVTLRFEDITTEDLISYGNNSNATLPLRIIWDQMLVAHTCNSSYSGGRDQEDHGSRPAWANSYGDPISKLPNTKIKGWRSGSSGKAPA